MIHRYELNGYHIVLDVNSASVHSVDDVAYDIIGLYETCSAEEITRQIMDKYGHRPDVTPEEISAVLEDIEYLKAEGKLFSEDPYCAVPTDFKKRLSVVKALCLHVAHDCNMACKYCFASEGEYHGPRGLMSFEVGKKALDYLVAQSGTRRNLEVDFFGGEPLLNFEVVKQLTAYGRELEKKHNKNFRFTLTTNGINLTDEVIEFANKEMSNVVLSLDGRKEVHDRLRVTRGGVGTYDTVVPRFLKMAQSRDHKNYYMRGTYTHFNTDFASDILHMADLGFKELSIEPVVAPTDMPWALQPEDLPKLKSEYERLALAMLDRARREEGFTFYHYMIDLQGGPCIVKRISGCGVGMEYLAVTPEGDFYPCHQFVGDPKYLLGNVDEGVTNLAALEDFRSCNIYSHKECDTCFARMYCSGGCAANAYHATGSVNGVYEFGCELHRKRIECAIMMQVALQEDKDKLLAEEAQ